MLAHPGPGVDGPGPGIIAPVGYEEYMAGGGITGPLPDGMTPLIGTGLPLSQVGFLGPDGMQVRWDVATAGGFDSSPLVAPGRYDFPQGAIYRLKLTNIPGREGTELYPTLEVAPTTPRTSAFIAHNTVPVQLTDEDLDQVTTGNFVTKVVYLPDPDYQELAVAGVETLVSTRLDPGIDPVVEADRRGSILAIIRIGNKDLESVVVQGAVPVSGVPQAVAGIPLGKPCGDNSGRLPTCFCCRNDGTKLRDAHHWHTHRTARSSTYSSRWSGRSSEAHDYQSHSYEYSGANKTAEITCAAGSWAELSKTCLPCLHFGAIGCPACTTQATS